MAVTRSKSGALPTPAPATNTTAQKPTKRKSASTSKAANKVAKTEDKPELSEAKAATEAAAEKKENDQEDVENIDNTNNGAETTSVPNVTPLVETSTAPATVLEEVKEPTPKTKPLSDMTTVLENPVAAQAAVPAPSTVIQASEPATAAADTAVPPAPTAPSSATIPAPVTQESSAPAKEELVVASTEEPSVHTSSITAIKPFDVVVSDIEGTTTPISFVKDNLFPYVTAGLVQFLQKNWGTEELQKAVEGLREQAAKDLADGVADAVVIGVESEVNSADKVQQDVIASIGWQMKADRKIGALKDFQGYMWREGYANGDLKGEIYEDVVKAFDQWKEQGKKLYIYSSGSVPAQKLLFGHSDKGDILHYFSGHYDTKIGLKVVPESYTKIATDIGVDPSKILFLSDNIHEIKAAKEAGMQAIVLDRPGNAELSAEDRANHLVVTSFLDIPRP